MSDAPGKKARSLFADRFEIVRELGRGGMGVVYAAKDTYADRMVAVKVVGDKYASDPDFIARFRRECTAAANLVHENIVRVYETNKTKQGQWYLVMELLEGMNLRQLLHENKPHHRLGIVHAALIAIQIADALRLAHDKGRWHRDIKPENIFVGKRARTWLLDFGLVKEAGCAAGPAGALTDEQRPLGTLRYMAPEQIRGKARPDRRVDFYQLGCVLFEMLTGKSPNEAADDPAATPTDILAGHAFGEARQLRDFLPLAPPRVQAILDKLLAKDPAERYGDAEELGNDLHDLILELVPPHHPAAVRSARARADASGEWALVTAVPASGSEPGRETSTEDAEPAPPQRRGSQAPQAETDVLVPVLVPRDPSPSWVARAGGQPANDLALAPTAPTAPPSADPPGVSRTARGTIRIQPETHAAAIAAADAKLAAAEVKLAAAAPPAPRWTATEPMTPSTPASGPRASRPERPDDARGRRGQEAETPDTGRRMDPAARRAPAPAFEVLAALWQAELSAEEKVWIAGVTDPRERKRRVLLARYVRTLPSAAGVDEEAARKAIDEYLNAVELPEEARTARTSVEPCAESAAASAPLALVSPVAPVAPIAHDGRAVRSPRLSRRRRLWIGAVAAGLAIAAAAAYGALGKKAETAAAVPEASASGAASAASVSTSGAAASSAVSAEPAASAAQAASGSPEPSASTSAEPAPSASAAPAQAAASTKTTTTPAKTWKPKPPCPPELYCEPDAPAKKAPPKSSASGLPAVAPPKKAKLPTNPRPALPKAVY